MLNSMKTLVWFFFFFHSRYLMSRQSLLKCLDTFSRTLTEASNVAIYHWRPWWCSCTRYNSMSWFKKTSNVITDKEKIEDTHTHPPNPKHPPQTKNPPPKKHSQNQTDMATVEGDWDLLWMCSFISQEVTGKRGREVILLVAYSLY